MKSVLTKTNESTHSSNTLDNKKGQDSFFGKKENDKNFFQPQIKIGSANDKFESEADQVADQVVSKKDNNLQDPVVSVQRQRDKEKQIQGKPIAETVTLIRTSQLGGDVLQGKPAFESSTEYEQSTEYYTIQRSEAKRAGDNNFVSDANLSNQLNHSKNHGSTLPSRTRHDMEDGIGADFEKVKVHTGQDAVQMNQDLNSKAFTSGNDIYFNEGQYNPGTKEGDRLLAHELIHTIQQGSSPVTNNPTQSKIESDTPETDIQKKAELKGSLAAVDQPLIPVNIASAFKPNKSVAAYLDKHHYKWKDVPVFIGKHAKDNIKVRQIKRAKAEGDAKYAIKSRQGLSYNGIDFLNQLKGINLEPVIALNAKDPNNISGFISIRKGEKVYKDPKTVINQVNKNIEHLGLLGISPLKVPDFQNHVINGVVTLKTGELSTSVAGFLDANGSFGLEGERFTFELNTQVNLKGLNGDFKIKLDEKGKFSGEGEIGVTIANLTGKVKATYVAGDVTVLGTVGVESEKFSGKVSIMVADSVKAQQTMMAELGVKTMEDEKKQSPSPKAATKKTKKNQVVIGWGSVTARITPWLEGTANIGIDDKGQVTIVGTIQCPSEIILMKQNTKRVDLFKVEIKAGYGVPLVGQIGLFASIGMFVTAGFGPLVLRNVKFEGTYSTDPSVLQNFLITGSLGISAFAAIGLEAKAGVFVTLLGHDIKAGIKATAMAGLKAYAEATPSFEYIEKKSAEGGKVGEAWLKGHFEAAAQLFLKLGGAFFVELDSPWWSPAPDKTWEYPLGEVEYPLGPSLGIGADVKWLVGSSDIPELKFSPVDFDASKFTSDIMSDPPKSKGGGKGGKQEGQGKWEDKSSKGGKKDNPEVKKDNKGLKGKKQEEDTSKWSDEKKYMQALGKVGDISDESKKQPIVYKSLETKLKQIKQQYRINQILLKNKKDGSVMIYVKHAKQNNSKHLIDIRLMSEAEREKLVNAAKKDLETKVMTKADSKAKTIKESDAKVVTAEVSTKHKVLEAVNVVDGSETWDFELDLGNKKEKVKGLYKGITEEDKKKHQLYGETVIKELKKEDKEDIPYDKLRKIKVKQVKELETEYNQKLRKPVVMKITLQSEEKDRKDNDIDFNVYIGPNDFIKDEAIEAGPVSIEPKVGIYKDLNKTSGANDQEAHHVPPKGLLKWVSNKAKDVVKDARKHRQLKTINKDNPWIKSLADMDEKKHTPGDNLAAINISKYTHIKKIGDSDKEVWRIHFGKETAKEIYKRMKDKGLVIIFQRKYNELTEEDKAEFKEHAEEAEVTTPTLTSSESGESCEDYVSTQFFQSELNAASKLEKEKWDNAIDKFKHGVGDVTKGAARQAHLAVTIALEKSDRDGTINQRKTAVDQLKKKSKATWNSVDGIVELNIF